MLYRFEDYTLDTQCYELRHAGVLCHLEPQVFAILRYLLAHRERVVSRQELLEHIWPERYISEATLDHRVMQARQAIGDSGQTQRAIQTLRGRGYRFVGTVEECLAPLSPSPPLPRLPSWVATPSSHSCTSGMRQRVRGGGRWYVSPARWGWARPPW
jgi:DNA-binding winged helix-turn-helix (wHTH) protein